MKLKFVSELIQIASLRFIKALKGSEDYTRRSATSSKCTSKQVPLQGLFETKPFEIKVVASCLHCEQRKYQQLPCQANQKEVYVTTSCFSCLFHKAGVACRVCPPHPCFDCSLLQPGGK